MALLDIVKTSLSVSRAKEMLGRMTGRRKPANREQHTVPQPSCLLCGLEQEEKADFILDEIRLVFAT